MRNPGYAQSSRKALRLGPIFHLLPKCHLRNALDPNKILPVFSVLFASLLVPPSFWLIG